MVGKLFRRFRIQRYKSPVLHEGNGWSGPHLEGRGDQVRVVWSRTVLQDHPHNHEHVVKTCCIGPGMAHMDVCWCGKQRFGVFGSWS